MYAAVRAATSRPKYSSTTCKARSMPEVRPAGGEDHRIALDVSHTALQRDLREALFEVVPGVVVRGGLLAVEDACHGELVRAGAKSITEPLLHPVPEEVGGRPWGEADAVHLPVEPEQVLAVALAESFRVGAEEESQHGASSDGEQLADHSGQELCFRLRGAPAQGGDPVIRPPLVAGRGPLVHVDQAALEQTVEHPVEVAGPDPDSPLGARRHFLDEAVAVQWRRMQRREDEQLGGLQRRCARIEYAHIERTSERALPVSNRGGQSLKNFRASTTAAAPA